MKFDQYGSMLSDDDGQKIVRAVRAMTPDASDEEIHRVLDWVVRTRLNFVLLESVLEGVTNCRWDYDTDDVCFVGAKSATGTAVQ